MDVYAVVEFVDGYYSCILEVYTKLKDAIDFVKGYVKDFAPNGEVEEYDEACNDLINNPYEPIGLHDRVIFIDKTEIIN